MNKYGKRAILSVAVMVGGYIGFLYNAMKADEEEMEATKTEESDEETAEPEDPEETSEGIEIPTPIDKVLNEYLKKEADEK